MRNDIVITAVAELVAIPGQHVVALGANEIRCVVGKVARRELGHVDVFQNQREIRAELDMRVCADLHTDSQHAHEIRGNRIACPLLGAMAEMNDVFARREVCVGRRARRGVYAERVGSSATGDQVIAIGGIDLVVSTEHI